MRDGLGSSKLGVVMSGLAGPWTCTQRPSEHKALGEGVKIFGQDRESQPHCASLWFPAHSTRHHETRVKAWHTGGGRVTIQTGCVACSLTVRGLPKYT